MVRVTTRARSARLIEGDWIEATQICQMCRIDLEVVQELSELGLVSRASDARRLAGAGDLAAAPARCRPADAGPGLNASGAALAVELLEAQRALERRIRDLEALSAGTLTETRAALPQPLELLAACWSAAAGGCGAGSARTAR